MDHEFKNKNLLLDGVIVIIALIVALNIHNANVSKKKMLLQEKGTELSKNEVLGQIASLEGKIDSYKSQVNKNIPDSSKIISAINNIAQESNVKIASIRPGQKEARDFYTKDRYSLSFPISDYHTLGKFISKLEANSEFFFVVEDVNLQEETGDYAGTDKNQKQIFAQLTVSVLFLN